MRSIIFLLVSTIFSFWLMFHTFKSDSSHLYISSKVYSDFGSLIPLIRYFPQGLNWPIQHPLYPGVPIRYHFLFYAPIGFLEKIGFPLSLSLNIPSALGFFSLVFLIYYAGIKLFKNSWVGLIGVILFIFNSSLSFVDFFLKNSLNDLPRLSNFVSFRPWNDSQVAAFWTLNIYTNQRHLAFSFAVCLLILLILYRVQNKYLYLTGFLFGSLLLLNQAGFLISAVIIFFALLTFPQSRIKIIISGIGFIPWIILYLAIFSPPVFPRFIPGFLADHPVTVYHLIKFWFYNYGLSLFLIIPALYISNRKLIFPLLTLFVIGNTFQLSPDMINNHKIFNFVFIIFGLYIGNLFMRFPRMLIFLPLIIFGGIIDIFPVINDRLMEFPDKNLNPDIAYFSSLPQKSVVLNSTWFFHPASLAGRSIFNGYSYFIWSYGYNQEARESQTVSLYNSDSLSALCEQLSGTPITHIEVSPHHESFINLGSVFTSLNPVYHNPLNQLEVFSVSQICSNI